MQERQDKYADEPKFSGMLSDTGAYIWCKKREARVAGHSRTAVRLL